MSILDYWKAVDEDDKKPLVHTTDADGVRSYPTPKDPGADKRKQFHLEGNPLHINHFEPTKEQISLVGKFLDRYIKWKGTKS